MKFFSVLLLLVLPGMAFSSGVEDKTRKLFEIQGVFATYQSLIDQSRVQAKENAKKTLDQMLAQLNPSEEFRNRFYQAADKYIKSLLTDRTAEQIVEVLVQYYSTKFSEQELDGLIAFYGSDLGKKDVMVSRESYQYMMQYYKAENDRIRVSATNEFIKDLQLIEMQCNCAKKASAKKVK